MHLKEGITLQNGKYRIIRFISSGGFGCTYKAEHVMLEKRVAIKEFFVKDFCNRDEKTAHVTVGTMSKKGLVSKLKKKFVDEAKALCHLSHPGIVHTSDVFEENGTAYFVMDYVDGESLSEIVNKRGPLSEQKAVHYISQLCNALRYVHSNNRLHLDIKPANVMIEANDNAILIDFGASKQYDEESGENTSTLMGKTPGYAPPEQMSNKVQQFTPATDIYALGATLYKILTGKTPPDASDRIAGEPLPTLPDNISIPTKSAIDHAIQLNKNARPQTIDEFISLLDGTVNPDEDELTVVDMEETTVKSPSDPNPTKNDKQKRPIKYKTGIIAVLCIAALIIGIGFMASKNGGAETYLPQTSSVAEAIAAKNVSDIRYYAENGDSEAAAKLGDIYRWGLYGVTDTLSKALERYEKAFNLGDAESAYKMGTMFLITSYDGSREKAVEWLRKAAEAGVADSWYYLATNLRHETDISESYKWAQKAEQAGYLKAKNLIAEGWYDKLNPNYKKVAQKELLELANANNPEAIGYIAGLYMNGYMGHSPRDLDGCYPWALKGSKLNDANSTETLGWYYYCIDDNAKAEECFNKASELGSILAMAKSSDKKYSMKRNEMLFNGDAILDDGMGIDNYAQYYSSDADIAKWNRRAAEYGWR